MTEAPPTKSDAHTPAHKHQAKRPRPDALGSRLRERDHQPSGVFGEAGRFMRASSVRTPGCGRVVFLFLPGDFLPVDVLSLDVLPVVGLLVDVLPAVVLLVDVSPAVGLLADVIPALVSLADVLPVVVPADWTPQVGVSGLKHSGTRGKAGCVAGRRESVMAALDPEPAGQKAIFEGPGDTGEGGADLQALRTARTLKNVVLSTKFCREASVRPRVRQTALGSQGQRSPKGRPALARAGVASASAVFLWVDGVRGRPRDRT